MREKYAPARYAGGKALGSRVLTAVLSVLAVLLAAVFVLSVLAQSDPQAGKVRAAQPSAAVAADVLKSAVTGDECAFSPEEMSGYLQYLVEKQGSQTDGLQVEAAVLTAVSDGTADLYFPVSVRGRHLGVSVTVAPSCDTENGCMVFQVRSVRIGRLPVRPEWAIGFVRNRLPGGLSAQGDAVYRDASVFSLNAGDSSADLKITKLSAQDGAIRLKVKGKVNLYFLGSFT